MLNEATATHASFDGSSGAQTMPNRGRRRSSFTMPTLPPLLNNYLPSNDAPYKNPHVAHVAAQLSKYNESVHSRMRVVSSNQRHHMALFRKQTWLVDPRSSRWVGWWDLNISLALSFTAIMTPIEVGFMRLPADRWHNPLFLLNRIVDLIFVGDMTLQVRRDGVQAPQRHSGSPPSHVPTSQCS